jgi:hypothetical protein
MKFRRLTDEELALFEQDLIQFLIVNHVYKEEWAALNAAQPEKAEELIQLFSDHVLQIVYEKVQFLELRTLDSCFVFHCQQEHLELIAIQKKEATDPTVDLSTPESIHDALQHHSEQLTFFRHRKDYSLERESEIHQLITQGCVNSSQEFWDALLASL